MPSRQSLPLGRSVGKYAKVIAGKSSTSAQQVAWTRAYLTSIEVIDDSLAESMLKTPWRELAKVLRWPGIARAGRNGTFGYLAGRTLFYDAAVLDTLDGGATQVVVLGAGYDSRAWRLARSEVRFFEVDHPATQADKRLRAPAGGPVYVAADLDSESVAEPLKAAGFSSTEQTVFVAEGLIMYLSEDRVRSLFESLSHLRAPASSLVTNAGIGFADDRLSVGSLVHRGLIALRGERFKFCLRPDQVSEFLGETGWTVATALTGAEVAQRYLLDTRFPFDQLQRDSVSFVVAESTPIA
jgi:methyltransferase (TIGR00027 family)